MRSLALVAALLLVTGDMVVAAPSAIADYDSEWVTETDFVSVTPGRPATFQVFFRNIGGRTWVKGTDTQVDLAACLGDKVTCDREPPTKRFDPGTWLTRTRYASQSQARVPPGGIAAFRYDVVVPGDEPPGTYRFYGALVVGATGAAVHPDGYFHELTVPRAPCAPAGITLSPPFRQRQVGVKLEESAVVTCADGTVAADVHITFTAQPQAGSRTEPLTLTAITDAAGIATVIWSRDDPGSDTISAFPSSRPALRAGAVARWTIAFRVLECTPTQPAQQAGNTTRAFDLAAWDEATGGALSGSVLNVGVRTFIPSGTATVNGTSLARSNVGATGVRVTLDNAGTARLVLMGADATVDLRIFIDGNSNGLMDEGEFRDDCARTTFGPA